MLQALVDPNLWFACIFVGGSFIASSISTFINNRKIDKLEHEEYKARCREFFMWIQDIKYGRL